MEGAPKSENEELLQALLTVTESMIFFQEFIEGEIGEMSYFRDSGSHAKLVETLNMLRSKVFQAAGPWLQKANGDSLPNSADSDEEEQVEVDVDYNEDSNEANELTIREVYSMSRAQPNGISGSMLMRNNSSVTITPVFTKTEEKKIMDQVSLAPPPTNLAPIILRHCGPPPPPPFIAANTPFVVSNFAPIMHGMNGADSNRFSSFNGNAFGTGTMSLSQFVDKLANERNSGQQQPSPKKKRGMKKSALPKEKKMDGKGVSASVGHANDKTIVVTTKDGPLNLKKKEKPYQCEKCPKRYSSRGVMSRHMKEAHNPNDPQFPCFYCSAKFRTGPSRLGHMNKIHTEALNSLKCPVCGRKSNTLSGKRNHMMLCHKKYVREAEAALAGELDTSQSPASSPTDSGVEVDKSPSFA